jgi:glycine hydroxymethyltransferase
MIPGGIIIGTPALTSRGFNENDFIKVAEFLDRIIKIALNIQSNTGTKLSPFL